MSSRYHVEALQTFADMARDRLPGDGNVTFEADLIRQLIGTIDGLAADLAKEQSDDDSDSEMGNTNEATERPAG